MSLALGLATPLNTYRPFRTLRHRPATQSPSMLRCGLVQRSATQYQELAFSCSSFVSCWDGTYRDALVQNPSREPGRRQRCLTRAGNTAEKGIFTPLVSVVRSVIGQKEFNKLRGKAISLHSQVIKEFGKSIGAEGKQIQGLIRLAKQNGGKLGFLS